MGRAAAWIGLAAWVAVWLAACSSVRLEQTTDCPTGKGLRGGVVSYRYSRELEAAHKTMAEYCSPNGYRIVSLNNAPAGEACPSALNANENVVAVRRTFVRFECEQDK